MGITYHQLTKYEQTLKKMFAIIESQNKLIDDLRENIRKSDEKIEILLSYAAITESTFEILDKYAFFNVSKTDLLKMIKSKKREAVPLVYPSVGDVDFLKNENEKRKQEIRDNVLDDNRQDEIAREIALKGDKIYAELSLTANNAQNSANNAQNAAINAQSTAIDAQRNASIAQNAADVANGMAIKAHETAESVQTDLAILDDVVEATFTSLETTGFLTKVGIAVNPNSTMTLQGYDNLPVLITAEGSTEYLPSNAEISVNGFTAKNNATGLFLTNHNYRPLIFKVVRNAPMPSGYK